MKYSYKIFVSMVIVLGLGFWGYGYWLMREIRSQYAVTIEDSLVDFSNVLASYLSAQAKNGKLEILDFKQAFKNFEKINFSANIHGVLKGNSPIHTYVTDDRGIVVFDSRTKDNVGKDFSQWNDVYLTLKGEYGARSTRINSSDPLSSVFYVAAPIQYENKIIGVVSVIKAEQSLAVFVDKGRKKIMIVTALVLLGATLIAALFSYGLTRPINALIHYAQRITKGESVRPPKSTTIEFDNLAKAFDEMRISLEGKKSVESFVQHLTHELKSPLSAIRGAAELLRDNMSDDKREMFISNIENESARARKQLDELLNLASLESRSSLETPQMFKLNELFEDVNESLLPLLEQKKLTIEIKTDPDDLELYGERPLFQQVISSLLSNAIEFSPERGTIQIGAAKKERVVEIYVRDQGPGVPEFAKNRIFEKFYSLERPSTGKKSTGLGLSFVKEAVSLHSGSVSLEPPVKPMTGANILISIDN